VGAAAVVGHDDCAARYYIGVTGRLYSLNMMQEVIQN